MTKKEMVKFLSDFYPEGLLNEKLLSDCSEEELKEACAEHMRTDILKKYPSGYMRGRSVFSMAFGQVFAIWNNLKKKPKEFPGQMSLFDMASA